MEKELGVPKPGDLLIGAIDFFAVLVPGVIAAALIVIATGRDLEQASSLFIAGLVTAGWVLGHVLHGIGSFLDPVLYDRLFKPADTVAHEAVNLDPVRKSNCLRAAIRKFLHMLRAGIHKYLHKNDELYQLAKEMTDAPHREGSHAVGAGVPGGMEIANVLIQERRICRRRYLKVDLNVRGPVGRNEHEKQRSIVVVYHHSDASHGMGQRLRKRRNVSSGR
jgi:hypothetical protein